MAKITTDPDKLYRPLMGYVADAGAYNTDARLRGSEAPVLLHPQYWVAVDVSDAEFVKIRNERFPDSVGLLPPRPY